MRIVDGWIEKNPSKARVNGIYKMGTTRPVSRIQNWDQMDEEQVRSVLEATQTDLTWAMEYELLRPDELGGPREEILDLIEEIHANGYRSLAERSEEAPVL
jgi:hypothetical protein